MQNTIGFRHAGPACFLAAGTLLLATFIAACSPTKPPQSMASIPPATDPAMPTAAAAPTMSPTAPVPVAVATADDYVYYPRYEIYYNGGRREYDYREGGEWVSRPVPPGIDVNVLLRSPSVPMDFHDSPAAHHDKVTHDYPKEWDQASPEHRDQNSHP